MKSKAAKPKVVVCEAEGDKSVKSKVVKVILNEMQDIERMVGIALIIKVTEKHIPDDQMINLEAVESDMDIRHINFDG
ncbi:14531_t:CDS:2 [Racocetra fulgida]|uniref:14531_t:CDS:1 n=1 Tax=Racocetra fulgida TaxID=60492 RepID=A0A9N9FH03_9GLOM|nr:14531_t:CDS:2 [Racocetra fulgida]